LNYSNNVIKKRGITLTEQVYDNNYDKRYELIVVILITLSFGFEFLDRLAMSYLLPIIQPELHITNTQIGLLGFINTGAYSISAVVFGIIQDKTGRRKVWFVTWMFLTFVATAVTAMVSSYEQLFVVRFFVGIVEGPLLGLFGCFLMQAGPKNFGRNYGIANAGVGLIAITLGPIMVTQLVQHFSWQRTYLLVAIPTLILTILLGIFLKEIHMDPEEARRQKEELKKAGGVLSMFKIRNVTLGIFANIFLFCGYWTLMLYGPLYLTNVGGYTVEQMGFISSTMGVLYLIWCVVTPKVSDIVGRRPAVIVAAILTSLSPFCMAVFPGTIIATIAYVAFTGMNSSMVPVLSGVIPIESVQEQLRTSAQGVSHGAGEFIGGACLPIGVGKVADNVGLAPGFMIGATALWLTAITTFFLKETNPVVLAKRAAKAKEQGLDA
jgi:MFS family permease